MWYKAFYEICNIRAYNTLIICIINIIYATSYMLYCIFYSFCTANNFDFNDISYQGRPVTGQSSSLAPSSVDLSLAKLCGVALGVRLNKTQQCSSWHVRPLLPEQVGHDRVIFDNK